MRMGALPAFMSVHSMYAALMETRNAHQIPLGLKPMEEQPEVLLTSGPFLPLLQLHFIKLVLSVMPAVTCVHRGEMSILRSVIYSLSQFIITSFC